MPQHAWAPWMQAKGMSSSTTTYESVLLLIDGVPSATSASHRDVLWITEACVVGVSRNADGQVEVFLAGDELSPESHLVKAAVEFRTWHRDRAASFNANRLLFPSRGHFDQVAAFICTELLRNGADLSLRQAFTETEPIIELAIERLRLTDQAILGLAGELLLFDALCRQSRDEELGAIIESWDGWRRSSRDFSLGTTGIEVKTTSGNTSSHLVEGTHQIERVDNACDRASEDRLLLVSIGLQPGEPESGAFTIPQLVDRIVGRAEESGVGESVVGRFLAHIAEYGATTGIGYKRGDPTSDPSFTTPFLTTFFRAYDMADRAIEVLRRDDVSSYHHVDASSVRFRVDLPISVSLGNPISGANQVARAILGAKAVPIHP